jgi:hypothetical protein
MRGHPLGGWPLVLFRIEGAVSGAPEGAELPEGLIEVAAGELRVFEVEPVEDRLVGAGAPRAGAHDQPGLHHARG